MGENRELVRARTRAGNLWYTGAIYLGIIGLWFLITAGWFGFENWRSYQRFAVIMFNKAGVLAMLFAGRYLFFPGNRSRRLFSWALAGALLTLIVTKMLVNFDYTGRIEQLAEFGDGVIWGLCGAWLLELIVGIYLEWLRAPLEVSTLTRLRQEWEMALLKLGLLSAGVICFLELYWLNIFAVELISVGYYLSIPFIGIGLGLYGIFSFRMNRWVEERVRPMDDLLGQMDGKGALEKNGFQGLPIEEIHRSQFLLLWRGYLSDLKKPGLARWVLGEYLVLSGLIISLPYWIKVVVEV